MVLIFVKASVSTPSVPLYGQSCFQGSLKNPSSPTLTRCHGSRDLIYALISFAHSTTTVGVQFGLLGRFRSSSAPQRGSLPSSQANTAGEFLYRVTTALTYSLKAVLIFGTLKNYVRPVRVNDLVHIVRWEVAAYVVVIFTPEVDGVYIHPEHVLFRFRRDSTLPRWGRVRTLRNRPSYSSRGAKA